MKRKFTLLIAALALLTMIVQPGRAWGQSDYSTDYTGNITLSTAGGTNASDCVIAISGTNYAGIKAGTSSKVGAVVVTVPSGTKYLHIHAAAWNGTTASLAVTPDGYSENIALTANSGIASNSPFTFNGDASTSDYYKVITFSDALTANTDLTFTAVGGKRFVIWGVTSEEESSGDTPSITADNVQMGCLAQGTSISYEIDNYVEGTMSAATEATWITNLEASPDPIDPSFGSIEVTTTINESLSARTATVTLTYTYGAKATVTKNVTVTQAGNPNASGGANNPYTVAQAIAAIDAQGTIEEAYATGIVCQVDSYNSTYSSITYWISDDGTTTTKLQVYSGKGINGADFSSINDVQVGATVVIKGKLKKFNSTYEFDLNNQQVSYVAPVNPIITVAPATINAPVEGANGILTVTYENITTVVAEVWFCNAAGTEAATYNWITADINADNNVEYLVEANDGAARTAYFKVWAYDDDDNEVYSNLVTISQDEYVAPTYAELPFSFNGGRDDIEDEEGLSQNGLGTDYNASSNPTTKLKFDNTGDWLLLQFNEKPGTLTFKIKGNGFSSGSTSTFKVQTSADGITYTDLAIYTELGDTETKSFDALDENVRYIKWIYTEKGATSGGNVGLGDINLAQYVAPQPSITVNPATVDATIAETAGYLGIAYTALTITQPDDFGIQFFDSNNQALNSGDEPDWITAAAATQSGQEGYFVYYVISANTGAARTAYFKVFALGDTDYVYSNLVTVTQVAAPVPSITVAPDAVNATAEGGNENLTVTCENMGDSPVLAAQFYTATAAPTTCDWISTAFNAGNLVLTVEANTGDARTAYLKVYSGEVYSNLVTISQAAYIASYTVTFDCDGGTFVPNTDFASISESKVAGTYNLPSATKDGWQFAGWNDGTTTYEANAEYTVSANVTFTAQWTEITTGTIAFGNNGTKINAEEVTGDDSMGNTWTITSVFGSAGSSFTQSSDYAQVGSGNKPATSITFTTTLASSTNITAFSAKFGGFNGTIGDVTLKVGETTVGSGALNGNTDVVVENTSPATGTVLTVTVTNIDKGVKCYYISYTVDLSTDPMIIAPASVDLAYNATSGEIGYSIVNPTTATLTAVPSATWIAIDNIDNTKVTFTTTENTEYIPRQGTITLSYEGADDVEVTVNQAAAPMPAENFALFTGNLVEGDYIIYYNGYAMKNTVTSGRLDYEEVTPNNVIETNNAAIIWHIAPSGEYWTIYSADADAFAASTGAKNKAQMLADGTDDKALWAVTGTEVYEFENKERAASSSDPNNKWLRNNGTYGFACYASSTGGALTLYKRTSAVASYDKVITGYGDNEGGYYLIASPVSVNPTNVEGMVELDNTTPSYPLYDLYRFDQTAEAEWYNYKAHNFYLTPGKGYLYASKETIDLTFKGMPYEGDGKINLTYDDGATLAGWNLIGNPYGTSATLSQAYYRLNAEGNALNAETESSAVNLMEGVFVKATEAGQIATFTAQSKNEAKAIAQTNIMVSNAKGSVIDNAIVRFDGGSTLEKFSLRDGSTQLYIPQNDYDYAIVSADAEGDMPLNFKAETTGQYTIRIKIDGASVGYMHLIDKLAGKDINLLINPEYSFIGSPRDAEDRFIIRFTEIDANNIFAYQSGSDIIVSGNGELQVFDVMGRMVATMHVNGVQTMSTSSLQTGLYIFRLNEKTQKIVVR